MSQWKSIKIFSCLQLRKQIRQKKTFLWGPAVVTHAEVGYLWEAIEPVSCYADKHSEELGYDSSDGIQRQNPPLMGGFVRFIFCHYNFSHSISAALIAVVIAWSRDDCGGLREVSCAQVPSWPPVPPFTGLQCFSVKLNLALLKTTKLSAKGLK